MSLDSIHTTPIAQPNQDTVTPPDLHTQTAHLLEGNGEFLYLPETIWQAGKDGALPLEDMLLALPMSQWMVMVMVLESGDDLSNWDTVQTHLSMIRTRDDIRYDYLDMHEANLLVSGKVSGDSLDSVEKLLAFYADSNMRYARKIYTEHTLSDAREIMPASIRAAYYMEKALACDASQHEQKLRNMGEAAKEWPLLGTIVKSYAELLGEAKAEEARKAEEAGEELAAMAIEVKKQLGVLVEGGMYAEAFAVVQQLKQMLPDDADLAVFEEEIQTHFS